jgi:two-component system, sensor histidine kinase and response regulator
MDPDKDVSDEESNVQQAAQQSLTMTPKAEIVLGIQAAQAELEAVLARLAELPEPALVVVQTTCHALRNYLYVTRGTTQLLQEALQDHPSAEVHGWVDGLLRASELMLDSVGRLEPSAPPSDPRIKWEVVDVGKMARRFSDHYRTAAAAKSISFESLIDATSPLAWTDRVMLASIFESIFSNAVKYSPPRKKITVTVQDSERGVLCTVRDQGPGLSGEDRARLFQPGARLSAKPTGNESSSGYGLVVAKQLADRLGVSLWCVSEPGGGCCFGIAVPSASPPRTGIGTD